MRSFHIIILLSTGILLSCRSTKGELQSVFLSEQVREVRADAIYAEAIKERSKGNTEGAIQLFKAALKEPGDQAPIYFELAKIAQSEGDQDGALKYIEKSVDLDPKNPWYIQFKIDLTEQMGRFDLCEDAHLFRIKHAPEKTDYLIAISDFYLAIKNYDKALEVYEKIESEIGVAERFNKNKYIIFHQQKKYVEAELELNKLIKEFPGESKYVVYKYDLLKEQDKTDEAIKTLEQGLENLPEDGALLLELAHHYFITGKRDQAMETYKGVMRDPKISAKTKTDVVRKLVRLSEVDGSLTKAVNEIMEVAGELHSDYSNLNILIGTTFWVQKDAEKSRSYFEKVLLSSKNNYLVWDQIMLCDLVLKDFSSMQKHAEEALEYFPMQPQVYYRSAQAFLYQKDYNSARDRLMEGLDLVIDDTPMRIQILSTLGEVYNSLKNYKESDHYFEMVMELDSSNALVLNNYAYFLSLRKDALDKAEKMVKKAILLSPNTPSYEDTYGWILFQKGAYELAKEWLEKALENGGVNSGEINEHLGDVYYNLGQVEKAVELWQKAKNLGVDTELLEKKISDRKWYSE